MPTPLCVSLFNIPQCLRCFYVGYEALNQPQSACMKSLLLALVRLSEENRLNTIHEQDLSESEKQPLFLRGTWGKMAPEHFMYLGLGSGNC